MSESTATTSKSGSPEPNVPPLPRTATDGKRATIYERLGVRPLINGAATLTRLGGSLMPAPVIEAMLEAAGSFVDVVELQQRAGVHIAKLTNNEAAYVSSGAAAGLALGTAACLTGPDPQRVASFLDFDWRGGRDQVVVQRCQRNPYDAAIRQVGIELVQAGTVESCTKEQVAAALGARTAAVVFFAGRLARDGVDLDTVLELAHAQDVPVIVDAAAQLPPPENLWNFTRAGADLVLFSGGKGLCGPQTGGLILGRKDLIAACALHGNPNRAIGRPMKVGKEEIAGMVAAVEHYLSLDHRALMDQYERQVAYVVERLAKIGGVSARRDFPNEAGQPMPRALVEFGEHAGVTADEVLSRLRSGEPSIYLSSAPGNSLYVNPQTLANGQETIVVDRLCAILAANASDHAR